MTLPRWDLVVVGGGFAGLACAQAAAVRGVRTWVIDRKIEPGARCHTTGILVKEVADEWDVPRHLTHKVRGVRLYAPGGRHVDLQSPGYYFLATDTPGLLRWFAQEARTAGAHVNYRRDFPGASYTTDGLSLDDGRASCRYLVGADGARSAVAEHFSLGANRKMLIGAEYEFEGVRDIDTDRLHVFLDSALAPGYIAWVVPGVGLTQVGLACRRPHVPRLDKLMKKVRRMFDFSGARRVAQRAGLIPVGGIVRPFARHRVMLVGDSAGMVSPLTAGGIHTAVHYGRAAGIATAEHLLDGGVDPASAMHSQVPSYMCKRAMRIAFDMNPPNRLYDLLFGNALFRRVAQTVFFHHRGLLSAAAWRDMVMGLAAE